MAGRKTASTRSCNPAVLPSYHSSSLYIPVIDDADDARIDGRFDRIERKARFLAANEEHLLANPGTDGVDGDDRPTRWLVPRRQRLHHEQLDADEVLVLVGYDHITDYSRYLHLVIW